MCFGKYILRWFPLLLSLVYTPSYSADEHSQASILINDVRLVDPELKACIIETAVQQNWVYAEQVTTLKCHGLGIKTLDGIDAFHALTSLSLYNNQLTRADVSYLSNLSILNLANNHLIDIDVKGLDKLTTLYLFKNNLAEIEFSGLSKLTKLRITDNQLTHVDISPLVALQKAYFFNNSLKDLRIPEPTNIAFIDVKHNPMPDEVYDRYDAREGITIVHDGNADDWQ